MSQFLTFGITDPVGSRHQVDVIRCCQSDYWDDGKNGPHFLENGALSRGRSDDSRSRCRRGFFLLLVTRGGIFFSFAVG